MIDFGDCIQQSVHTKENKDTHGTSSISENKTSAETDRLRLPSLYTYRVIILFILPSEYVACMFQSDINRIPVSSNTRSTVVVFSYNIYILVTRTTLDANRL